MKHGSDESLEMDDLIIVHQNIPKRSVADHSHDMHEIILPLAGQIKVTKAGTRSGEAKSCNARRGEMILIPAGLEHAYEVKGGDAEQVIVLFSPSWLDEQPVGLTILQHSVLVAELAILLLLDGMSDTRGPVHETLRLAVRRSIGVARLNLPAADLRVKIRDDRLRKAVAYMESNLSEQDVLNGAATAAATSGRTLTRLCKTDLGLSPGDLLRTLRMGHAKKLLTTGQYSVTEVAFECGYSSMSQFINTFKAATGTLPSQFRKK